MTANPLALRERDQEVQARPPDCMPVVPVEVMLQRRDMLVQFVKRIMEKDTDFGVIPGSTKPTLLKPGAEKLCNFFGLAPEFEVVAKAEDWGSPSSEPLFSYTYRCRLIKNGQVVGSGDGHCNSRETKYRYRQTQRLCPKCGKDAIIKGKAEYGGGWICFEKKGGCKAKFKDGDKSIEDQQVGRTLNADVADLVNTIVKMAQKRALVAAVLVTTSASEFYTQDIEEGGGGAPDVPVEPQKITANHRKALFAEAKKHGWTEEMMKTELKEGWGLEHTRDILMADYPEILKHFSDPAPKPPITIPTDQGVSIFDLPEWRNKLQECAILAEQLGQLNQLDAVTAECEKSDQPMERLQKELDRLRDLKAARDQ